VLKDNDLHSDPSKYHTYNLVSAEVEVSLTGTEALENKLRYIEYRYSELVTLMGAKNKGWVSLDNLSNWYEIIESELIRRLSE